jgi:antitoxin MazE
MDIRYVRYIFYAGFQMGQQLGRASSGCGCREALDLKEGDEVEISIAGKCDFKVARDLSKERALEQFRQMKWFFPPDFKFNREEINER